MWVTFLDLIIEELARQGFGDIILLVGYLGHLIEERYCGSSPQNARVRVFIELEPWVTAGPLRGGSRDTKLARSPGRSARVVDRLDVQVGAGSRADDHVASKGGRRRR